MLLKELNRRYKVIDMMLTMHSILRDRFLWYSLITDLCSLCISIMLCSIIFLDPNILIAININQEKARIITGICSVLILMLTIISLRVDWDKKAEMHDHATKVLSQLKLDYREIINSDIQFGSQKAKELSEKYAIKMAEITEIPDNQFNRLRSLHYKKIELSKLISKHPGCPVLVLRVYLLFKAIFHLFRGLSPINTEREEEGGQLSSYGEQST